MADKEVTDWALEKNLVHHQLDQYGKDLKEILDKIHKMEVKLEVLNSKVMTGAAFISVVVSVIIKFIPSGGN